MLRTILIQIIQPYSWFSGNTINYGNWYGDGIADVSQRSDSFSTRQSVLFAVSCRSQFLNDHSGGSDFKTSGKLVYVNGDGNVDDVAYQLWYSHFSGR